MKRYSFVLKVKKERIAEYKKRRTARSGRSRRDRVIRGL